MPRKTCHVHDNRVKTPLDAAKQTIRSHTATHSEPSGSMPPQSWSTSQRNSWLFATGKRESLHTPGAYVHNIFREGKMIRTSHFQNTCNQRGHRCVYGSCTINNIGLEGHRILWYVQRDRLACSTNLCVYVFVCIICVSYDTLQKPEGVFSGRASSALPRGFSFRQTPTR